MLLVLWGTIFVFADRIKVVQHNSQTLLRRWRTLNGSFKKIPIPHHIENVCDPEWRKKIFKCRGRRFCYSEYSKMPDGVVSFMIMVFRWYGSKNCGTTSNYERARVFFLYNISLCTGLFCTGLWASDRGMHCTCLVISSGRHFVKYWGGECQGLCEIYMSVPW